MNEPLYRDILRMLCRIPVPQGQLVLYRLAVQQPETGFTSTDVRAALELNQAQHRGLMAALTVRINNSPRETSVETKPGLGLIFDQTWDGYQNTYKPRPELLTALQQRPPLRTVMKQPMDEVLRTPPVKLELPGHIPAAPPAAPKPGRPAAADAFDAVLDDLEARNLVYSSELVSNVLLSLQVKRFVILTGISGTGKTKLAQVVADRFKVQRPVDATDDPGDLASVITVMPYMLKHRRMVIPRSLAVQVPGLVDDEGSGSLRAKWPGGETDLTVWRGTGVQVMFRGELRRWFQDSFKEGDTFLVHLEGEVDGPTTTLVFGPAPKTAVRDERVANTVVMAVRPDWTDHRGLLGAYNPLTRQYLTTPFLRLLLDAQAEHLRAEAQERAAAPFFLILDEMNLARVEHYFADFLSALESGEPLHLHDSVEIEEGLAESDEQAVPVPRILPVPPNVFFVGTVNVDESTYLFSPKVLDRAFTIELNSVDLGALAKGIDRGGELVLDRWNGRLDPPAKPSRKEWQWFVELEEGALGAQVYAFHALLARHNRHFGYRVATELARYVWLAAHQTTKPGPAAWVALDLALLQKVLVKLHGTRHELGEILDALLRFTLVGADGDDKLSDLSLWKYLPEEAVVRRKDESAELDAVFPRSAAKLWRMRERLRETGFTSWIE